MISKQSGSTEPIIDYTKPVPLLPKLDSSTLVLNEDGIYEVRVKDVVIGEKIHIALEFLDDLTEIVNHVHKSINKSLAHSRLNILDEKFKLHRL